MSTSPASRIVGVPMLDVPVTVLLVEDNEADALVVRALLREPTSGSPFDLRVVRTLRDAIAWLAANPDAVVLLDLSLPDCEGLASLTRLLAANPDAAVVVLTVSDDPVLGAAAIRAGAQEYLVKGTIGAEGLWRVLRYARERVNVSRALLRAESRYRQIVETALDAVIQLDVNGNVSDWNPQAEALLGWSRSEMLGCPLDPVLPPEELAAHRRRMESWRQGGRSGPLERRVLQVNARRRDGANLVIEVAATRTGSNESPTLTLFLRDVTSRVQAEERLRSEKAFTERLIASLPGAFILLDSGARIRRWNAHMERVLGFDADAITGREMATFVAPQDIGRAVEHVQQAFQLGVAATELRLRTSDGHEVPFQFSAARVDVDGEPCLVVLGVDLTERHRLEERFLHTQKMESVGRLAGGVAHDFNNTLGAVMAFAEVALMSTAADDPRREDIEAIKQAALKGADLTRQLLVFSRRQMTTPKVFDANAAIAGLDKLLRRVIGEPIELVTLFAEGSVPVEIDPGLFESVLMNLAINAKDAMPQGGTLAISTSAQVLTASDLLADEMAPGAFVRISVADTGIGMKEEVRRRVFEPFFTTKESGKGTGLGLASAYQIVRQAGGRITFETQPGKGTTFMIDLPLVGGAEALEARSAVLVHGLRGTETILMAEDNDLARRAIGAMLEGFGYTVLAARSGVEAIEIATRHEGPIHLMLSDVVMPHMGALELRDRMAAVRPGTPILFMSGYTDDGVLRSEAKGGALPFIHKPFTAEAIARKVREVLEQ